MSLSRQQIGQYLNEALTSGNLYPFWQRMKDAGVSTSLLGSVWRETQGEYWEGQRVTAPVIENFINSDPTISAIWSGESVHQYEGRDSFLSDYGTPDQSNNNNQGNGNQGNNNQSDFWNSVAPYEGSSRFWQVVANEAVERQMTPEQLATEIRQYGGAGYENVTAQDVTGYLSERGYNVGDNGWIVQGSPGGGSPGGGGPGTGGTPQMGPAEWAQIAQANVDARTQLQNSIFNNPNYIGPDGSTQTTTFGQLPDYASYVQSNPDLVADFEGPDNPFPDMESFGRWHWENHGQAEGRTLPTGSVQDLGYLQPEVRVQLSPEQQAIYDANQRSSMGMAATGEAQINATRDALSTPFNVNGAYDPSGAITNFNPTERTVSPTVEGYEAIRDAIVGRQQHRLDAEREQTINDLMLQGHNPGTQGWDDRMRDLAMKENDFEMAAQLAAGDVQGRMFGMESGQRAQDFQEQGQTYGIGSDWRNQNIREAMLERQQPLNELNALRTGSQVSMPGMQGYQGFAMTAPDYAGAEQEQWNRNFMEDQQRDARRANAMNAVGQLGGAIATGGWW